MVKAGSHFFLKRVVVKLTAIRKGCVYYTALDTDERGSMEVAQFTGLAVPAEITGDEIHLQRSDLDKVVIDAIGDGLNYREIAEIVGYSYAFVYQIARRCGVRHIVKRSRKPPKLPNERVQTILIALQSGHLTRNEIAQKAGVTKQRVSQIAKINGLTSKRYKSITDVLDRVMELIRQDEKSYREIAVLCGVSHTSVVRIAKKNGIMRAWRWPKHP